MVKRVIEVLSREFSNVHQAALLLGVAAFVSQILGLARDRLLANIIGPSETLDIYYSAFRIPDFLFVSIASLVSITVLIPFIVELLNKDDESREKARELFSNIFTVFLLLITLSSVIFFIFIPKIITFITPGFSVESLDKVILVSRIMLLQPILLGLSNLFGSITQLYKRFFVWAVAPLFYNIGVIIGILFFYKTFGIIGLAFGVVLGALMHLLIQLPVLFKYKFVPKFSSPKIWKETGKVFLLSIPRTIGLSCNSIAEIAIISIATTFTVGSVSVYQLSFNMESFPITIIGLSYSVAVFPLLASLWKKGDHQKYLEYVSKVSRQIIFYSLPTIALFVVLRAHIVRVVLGSGNFSWTHTRLVAASLALFTLAVIGQSMIHLFVRAYYAKGDTYKPLLVNIISASFIIFSAHYLSILFINNHTFRYFLESLLRVVDVPGTEVLVLPLSYAIGSIINAFVLIFLFAKDMKIYGFNIKPISRTFLYSLGASCFVGLGSYLTLNIFVPLYDQSTFIGILLQGLVAGLVGISIGLVVLKLLKSEELDNLYIALRNKFWKTEVVTDTQNPGL